MRSRKRVGLAAASFLGLTMFIGCDDSKPSVASSLSEATVKGTVRIDGKPVTKGDIVFDASNYQRQMPPRTAAITKDGTYEIKTPVGENTVKLGGMATKGSSVLQSLKRGYVVKSGDNTFDFEGSVK